MGHPPEGLIAKLDWLRRFDSRIRMPDSVPWPGPRQGLCSYPPLGRQLASEAIPIADHTCWQERPLFAEVGRCEVDGDPALGESAPEFLMAARTRSFASWTAASGRPTMVKAGSPGPMSTSTSTSSPSSPTTTQASEVASVPSPPPIHLVANGQLPWIG